MITIISDRLQVQKLHNQFHSKLNRYFTERIFCRVGFHGGSFEDIVYYSSELGLWIGKQELDNRFWNGFGVGRPSDSNSNSIIGEINFPLRGLNRRVAGAFAIEKNGNALVLHRGKIGGGKVGIGKHYFTKNFRGDFVTAIDGDRETEFCLVGELNSQYFPDQIDNFIREVVRVKNLENGETAADFSGLTDFNYTDEQFATIFKERNEPTVIERTHGIIVNALARQLERREQKVGNDRNRDLFIYHRGRIRTLFEVKTLSAFMQLLDSCSYTVFQFQIK